MGERKKEVLQYLQSLMSPGQGGIIDKYINKSLKLKDLTPDIINTKIGQGFSNAKLPAGYETAIDPGRFIQSGLNTMSGVDKRLWDNEINPPLQKDQVPVGNQYADISEFNIRDFLNRRGFGMSNEMSGRGSSLEQLGLTDNGNNDYTLNRGTKVADTFYKKFDPQAEQWAKEQINTSSSEPIRAIKPSRFQNRKWPIMANVSNSDVSFGGEGQDQNGYYNIVKMSDKFDYALHPDESINSPVNLGRTILDQFMEPASLTAEKKVYIPGIKKKARTPGNPRRQNVQSADTI